jgi:hypothetical protein
LIMLARASSVLAWVRRVRLIGALIFSSIPEVIVLSKRDGLLINIVKHSWVCRLLYAYVYIHG